MHSIQKNNYVTVIDEHITFSLFTEMHDLETERNKILIKNPLCVGEII